MWVLTEQGLYFFLARSDKPLALPFQKWIAGEVIPSIRKTGGFIARPLTGDELILAAVSELQNRVSNLNQTVAAQQAKIESDRPKVEFANQIGDCTDGLGIREFGIIFRQNGAGFGQDGLVQRLLNDGYLYRDQHGKLRPYAEYTDEDGLFWTKTTLIASSKGNFETVQVKITGKGQKFFLAKYIPQVVLPQKTEGIVLVDDYNGNEVAVEMATASVPMEEGRRQS
jgi:anti-repressor protein